MHFFVSLLEQIAAEPMHGGGKITSTLDCINNPARPECNITPNRPEVFKQFNYRFKKAI